MLLYERMVWYFKHVKSNHIKRSTDILDWEVPLNNLDANDQVSVFNSTVMNIVINFIANEALTYDDDLEPPWMNSFIKTFIHTKDNFYKKFVRKSNEIYHLCAFKNF